jgi:hypothetical protein
MPFSHAPCMKYAYMLYFFANNRHVCPYIVALQTLARACCNKEAEVVPEFGANHVFLGVRLVKVCLQCLLTSRCTRFATRVSLFMCMVMHVYVLRDKMV